MFEAFHDARVKILFEPIIDAITDRSRPMPGTAPYPPSKVITGIAWAPKETIVRKAKGQRQLAADLGRRRPPVHGLRRRQGVRAVRGRRSWAWASPASRAIRRTSRGSTSAARPASRTATAPGGKKASGMLMVDGVLYLWTRNAGNAQLAWSKDHGKTWAWADWKFTTSFGCPTFLNFGKNYAGARDEFVYVYSHDADSAYEPADRMVLARVPKGKITRARRLRVLQRASTRSGQPLWSKEIAERGGGLHAQGPMLPLRHHATTPASKRYLWVQIIPGTRRQESGHALRGRLRHLRRARAVGAVDDGVLHREVGRRPRRDGQLPDQVDERRRQDAPSGVFGRRPLRRPQGDADGCRQVTSGRAS